MMAGLMDYHYFTPMKSKLHDQPVNHFVSLSHVRGNCNVQVGSTSSAAVDPLSELGDIAKVRLASLDQQEMCIVYSCGMVGDNF
jgi:hypothetical protein